VIYIIFFLNLVAISALSRYVNGAAPLSIYLPMCGFSSPPSSSLLSLAPPFGNLLITASTIFGMSALVSGASSKLHLRLHCLSGHHLSVAQVDVNASQMSTDPKCWLSSAAWEWIGTLQNWTKDSVAFHQP